MEHGTSVTSLMLVVGLAFFIPIILLRLRLRVVPIVVAEIIVGIIIGKSGFNIVTEDMYLELLSTLGLIYLMFLSGVEIDFSIFKKKKESKNKDGNPFYIGMVIFLLMLLFSFLSSVFLVKIGMLEEPFLMTVILSSVSLGIIVPVLKEKKMLEDSFGQTILITAVIADFLAMILFAFYLANQAGNTKQMVLLVVLIAAVFIIYQIVQRIKHKKFYQSLLEGTSQIGTRGVFALILFLVALSETIGMENILGSFLAGVVISLIAPNKEFVHKLDSFGYGFLIPIFFVMVGVKFDLKTLFEDEKTLLLIPLVFVLLFASRIIPTFVMKKWFGWKKTIASGFLLSSTLSMAIVASSVSLEMGFITPSLNSAIILIVILSCFISPIVFNNGVPKEDEKQKRVTIIGSNQLALFASLDFRKDGFDVKMYTIKQKKVKEYTKDKPDYFSLIEIDDYQKEILENEGAFDTDMVIVATSDAERNIMIARWAKEYVEEVIVRVENPENNEELKEEGFIVFSTIYSSRILLRAMVNHPMIVNLFTESEDAMQEMKVGNSKYDGMSLRSMPFLGDALILRIYRDDTFIIPHGDTVLQLGDKLLVSGSAEHLNDLRKELK